MYVCVMITLQITAHFLRVSIELSLYINVVIYIKDKIGNNSSKNAV